MPQPGSQSVTGQAYQHVLQQTRMGWCMEDLKNKMADMSIYKHESMNRQWKPTNVRNLQATLGNYEIRMGVVRIPSTGKIELN